MNFIEEVMADANDIWEQCANVSFLTELGNGTLSRRKFIKYVIQDSIYLRDYVRIYAMALFKSRTLKEMKVFYSALGFVNDSENVTRLEYLEDIGMNDDDIENAGKAPACKKYTDFLMYYAVNEDIPEILMALMPCMFGYAKVFKLISDRYPQVMDSYYGKLVKDYTSDKYNQSCYSWMEFVNEVCAPLDSERKTKLKEIYIKSSMLELYFWKIFDD
jgi:thiaminase/transcriptional activator TenA